MLKHNNANMSPIQLSMVKGIGNVVYKKLIDHLGSALNVVQKAKSNLLPNVSCLLKESIVEEVKFPEKANDLWTEHQRAGVEIVAYEDQKYPRRLKELYSPPSLLYCEGEANLNSKRSISIVGTRNASSYGKKWVENFVHDLKPYGVTIISGLAYGIDVCAHEAALREDMSTIAVLAGGLDRIYPSSHTSVAREISKKGALVSEMPVGSVAEKYNFPARNRIITGLSDAVIIVEAGEKSGALITAKYAHELNREVFALPGDIHKNNSKGCHSLIKSHQASLITSASDLVDIMNWDHPSSSSVVLPTSYGAASQEEKVIMSGLDNTNSPCNLDDLSKKINIAPHILLCIMQGMEQKRQVSLLPGNRCQLYR